MRKRIKRLKRNENVLVFPGTQERLIEKGLAAVDRGNFEMAVDAFEHACRIDADPTTFLGPYAVALYETKHFEKAKEIAAKLLHSGTSHYLEAMELYLSICIQLQDYEEVETTIGALLDEGIIPEHMLKKFIYLRELNKRLAARYDEDDFQSNEPLLTIETFSSMSDLEQQQTLAALEGADLSKLQDVLTEIVQLPTISPLVSSFALILLRQAECVDTVIVEKFDYSIEIVPAALPLPGADQQTQDVVARLEEKLEKDPTRLEMARGLIEKYAIVLYPIGWKEYTTEEVANAYEVYIDCLFTGKPIPDEPIFELLQLAEV